MFKIGMFDSGIGGLNTLEVVKKYLPNEDIIYYQDTAHNPYGEKTDEELEKITTNIVNFLINNGVKEIIIACNTATTRCIKKLREKYKDIIFIGTEPAIKLAIDKGYKNILILATPATTKSTRLQELIDKYQTDQKIYKVAAPGLADAIEQNNKNEINELLNKYLNEYKDKNIDAVVLGCTHYSYVEKEILSILNKATLLDGNDGVARQAKKMLENNNLLEEKNKEGKIKIIETKK